MWLRPIGTRGWMCGRAGALCLSLVQVRSVGFTRPGRILWRRGTGTRPPHPLRPSPCPYRVANILYPLIKRPRIEKIRVPLVYVIERSVSTVQLRMRRCFTKGCAYDVSTTAQSILKRIAHERARSRTRPGHSKILQKIGLDRICHSADPCYRKSYASLRFPLGM
jgi:hypothetical protein